jgi:hypothetical protein
MRRVATMLDMTSLACGYVRVAETVVVAVSTGVGRGVMADGEVVHE